VNGIAGGAKLTVTVDMWATSPQPRREAEVLRAIPVAVVEPAHAAFKVNNIHRFGQVRLLADMLRSMLGFTAW